MKFHIGFHPAHTAAPSPVAPFSTQETVSAVPSVVDIAFPHVHKPYSYYNNTFDLHCGDAVYVDGKLEGVLGRVVAVNRNFKIKPSAYKNVIAKVDATVHGTFHTADAHMVTFDPHALPIDKARLWFFPPDDEEFVCGHDDTFFPLDNLSEMDISISNMEKGVEYYTENKVQYLCLDGNQGYAIVQGSESYEVTFSFDGSHLSNLTCSCYCTSGCKHTYAAMLHLRELLGRIARSHSHTFEQSKYFAAIFTPKLFEMALHFKDDASITL